MFLVGHLRSPPTGVKRFSSRDAEALATLPPSESVMPRDALKGSATMNREISERIDTSGVARCGVPAGMRLASFLVLVSSAATVVGCIAWHDNPVRSASQTEATWYDSGPVPIRLRVTDFIATGSDADERRKQRVIANVTVWGEDALKKGKAFRIVSDVHDADYSLVLSVRDRAEVNTAVAVVCFISLFVLPCLGTDVITVDAELRSKSGSMGSATFTRHITSMIAIPLLIGTPFASVGTKEKQAFASIFEELDDWSKDLIRASRAQSARPAEAPRDRADATEVSAPKGASRSVPGPDGRGRAPKPRK